MKDQFSLSDHNPWCQSIDANIKCQPCNNYEPLINRITHFLPHLLCVCVCVCFLSIVHYGGKRVSCLLVMRRGLFDIMNGGRDVEDAMGG